MSCTRKMATWQVQDNIRLHGSSGRNGSKPLRKAVKDVFRQGDPAQGRIHAHPAEIRQLVQGAVHEGDGREERVRPEKAGRRDGMRRLLAGQWVSLLLTALHG